MPTEILKQSDIHKINTTLRKFPQNTQFSIAKFVDGVPQYYGVVKKQESIVVIDNRESVFEIGSISKVFTSAMLAQLSIDEKISLDDEISDYLDFAINHNSSITFTQLANHTSGLPRLPPGLFWPALFKQISNPYEHFNESKLVEYVKDKLKQKKVGKFRYSNLAVGLLGYIICRIMNSSYESALQQLICNPLCLKSTTTNRNTITQDLIKGRNKKGNEVPFWDLNVLVGAGGIYSNVEDLTRFVLSQFDSTNLALQLQHKSTLKISDKVSIGLAWHIINSEKTNNANWYYHNGATGGFRSEMVIDVENKNSVILLSNVSGEFIFQAGELQKLVFELMMNE